MKILVVGAPRSGTTSVGDALVMLGFSVHRGIGQSLGRENPLNENYLPQFTAALRAKYLGEGRRFGRGEFDAFIGCFEAAHGLGITLLAEDLIQAYPDALVILTPRDADSWTQSFNKSIVKMHKSWEKWRWMLPICGGVERDFQAFRDIAVPVMCGGDINDLQRQRQYYLEHNQRVRDLVPRDRLLEFPPGGGWAPLCRFVGKPIPQDMPFPHAMSRIELEQGMAGLWRQALERALTRIAACAVVLVAVIVLLVR